MQTAVIHFLRKKLFLKNFRRYCEVKLGIAGRNSRNRRNRLLTGNASWTDLRKYSKFTTFGMTHDFYEQIITSFDPLIRFDDLENARFVGEGMGLHTLNSYRKVTLTIYDAKLLAFEKVYWRDSADFKKMSWFYDDIYFQIKHHLEIPGRLLTKGDRVVVVYFDWVEDLSQPPPDKIIDTYLMVSELFDNIVVSEAQRDQKIISDFCENSFFHTKFKKARLWLKKHNGPQAVTQLEQICKYVTQSGDIKRGFVHGDLNKENLMKKGLIDFDYCGYHPKAFEHASFITCHFTFDDLASFYNLCTTMNVCLENSDEKLALLFFCFVFDCRQNRLASDDYLKLFWQNLIKHARKMQIIVP